jgi:hypothetical protein
MEVKFQTFLGEGKVLFRISDRLFRGFSCSFPFYPSKHREDNLIRPRTLPFQSGPTHISPVILTSTLNFRRY